MTSTQAETLTAPAAPVADPRDAAAQLKAKITPDMGFTAASAAARNLAKLRQAGFKSPVSARVAVLANSTTSQLESFLDVYLFPHNVDAELYHAPYGLLRQEVLDPTSGLYSFTPKFVFLAATRRDLQGSMPSPAATPAEVDAAVDAAASEWETLWHTLRGRIECQIIQNNFELPAVRTFGDLELSHPGAPGNFIDRVNKELAKRAPKWVSIHDLDGLSASVGRWSWGDDRFFHLAKLPCAPENLTLYAHKVAAIMAARLGRSRKCLVLDLDNTLWGGVIGDDGLAGINIGQGDAVGEAYVAFQQYAKALAQRGVILAVCSKNEEKNAKEPFEKHADMVLKLKDISCFVANWEDKAANIRRIAQELNIGLDSLVFVDDNPAERAIVRRLVPEVAVPEIPVDPADYVRAVEQHRYFETVAITGEDFQRTEQYHANAERRAIETSAGDIESYLKSLDMKALIRPVGDVEMDRTVQLIGKSNQFNLTTRRHGAGDVQAMRDSPEWVTRVVNLADRFGDNGLISVIFAKAQGEALYVDTWLMSCRVLKRGVEALVLNSLAAEAQARGLKYLEGEYIPTAKNDLVKDHYESLGFTQVGADPDGRTLWRLTVGEGWAPAVHYIATE
jgi:FkbH-like protein